MKQKNPIKKAQLFYPSSQLFRTIIFKAVNVEKNPWKGCKNTESVGAKSLFMKRNISYTMQNAHLWLALFKKKTPFVKIETTGFNLEGFFDSPLPNGHDH